VVAKVSYFGKFEHFVEDHTIINILAKKLKPPYHRVLARSLMKDGRVFTYRHRDGDRDIWVVFYNPIRVKRNLPRRLKDRHIVSLGKEVARFHKACSEQVGHLPTSSKTMQWDLEDLIQRLDNRDEIIQDPRHAEVVRRQVGQFQENWVRNGYDRLLRSPIFVDWNIGNFSLTREGALYSRWDYDWFRMCTRVLDFYFFSRVVSDAGDRTVFSYLVDPLLEDRFLLFLRAYHGVYPLSESDVRFIKEAYRFFILNYVAKYGKHFFRSFYAAKLQQEAYEMYLPGLDERFDLDRLLRTLQL
jgi:Ser/Thr protein kinase RdoA (MazF antagonist)